MAQLALKGRSQAMAQALDALRRAERTGQGALVAITGEAGIGKTAVLRALVAEAARAGFRTGSGKAEEGDQIAPGAPLLVALRSGPQPLLPGDAFASLAPLYDRPLWLVDRISSLLEELAVHGPVLIAIDDLQWADRMTRFALRVLPGRLAGSPVVWAVTSRRPAEALEEAIAGNDDAATLTRIHLGPLSVDAITDLAAERLGTALSPQIRRLLDGVGGNPFWAVQVVDGLAGRPDAGADLPDLNALLSSGVRSRMAGLSERAATLVRLAAVWGRGLPISDAAHLLGDLSHTEVEPLVAEGAAQGLLDHADGEVYFPHDLVREALYTAIAPQDRRAMHRRCARYLVDDGGRALAAAVHFRASATPDDDEAVLALLRAADECAVSMPEQAADLARTAFGLTSAAYPLWHTAGERAIQALVDVRRETEALAIAEDLLAAPAPPETEARVALQTCRALWWTGDCVAMERRAQAALMLDGISPESRARLCGAVALAASRTRPARAAAMARDALSEGRRVGDGYAQRLAVVAQIEVARNEGRHQLALHRFADLRRLSDTAYQAEEIRTLQHLDRYDDAEAMLAKIREAHEDVDALLPSMLYAQMWQDHNLARFDAAEAGARTLLRLSDETGNHCFRLNARMVLAAVATYRGDRAAVTTWLTGLEDDGASDRRGTRIQLMQGWLRAGTGDLEAALETLVPLLDSAVEFRDPWPWSPPWLRIMARIALAAGRPDVARTAADMADIAAHRNPGVATLEGTALHLRASLREDPETFASAVAVLRKSPRPMLVADALTDLGASLLAHHRTDEGVAALSEAAQIYGRTGAVSGSRAVSEILRANGVRDIRVGTPTRRPQAGWDALTPTELRVVELISSGHTNRSAAAELSVSPNTVNTHLRAVFRKLSVRSRVQLTIAYRDAAR
ncbi:LuxR family transcriptional regulator [Mycolicibacterium sp. F2034L]|uniref:helix-turn-helix transcriptional regulator n=1 Tax=Mycolicibacterium sp. F2034L TaxID=2926422 RepID=UPI001FF0E56D|nr:LuxR family transcriptional regulator [Mycolicibacterium sp. F2034L]MCK0173436.1 LuxR C-terminal-related transcriptional regulator [Mycolicibacterium sp. F2034L]